MSSPPMTEWDVEPVELGASTGAERLEMLRSRLAATFDDAPAAAETVERVAAAAATLHDVDRSGFDAVTMRTWLEGVEQARRTVEAAAVAAAGAVDRSNPFRGHGFFTAKSAVKHMCRLSGPEAHRRVQTARLHAGLPAWGQAEAEGRVGVAQSELMARVVANPRLPADVVERDAPALLDDATNLPYDDLERHVRTGRPSPTRTATGPRTTGNMQTATSSFGPVPKVAGRSPPTSPTSPDANSRRSSPGTAGPSGAPTGPTRATASATQRPLPICHAPRPNVEPMRSSPWPALRGPTHPGLAHPDRRSTS